MTPTTLASDDFLYSFDSLEIEAIELEPTELDRAIQLSDRAVGDTRQWPTYLNALALFGCERWVAERLPELAIDTTTCSLLEQPSTPIDAVCNVRIGDFKVCLLAVTNLTDESVTIPRAAIDLPEFSAQFYILVQVNEEIDRVTIQGYLRYDRLVEIQRSLDLQPTADWMYNIPLECFDLEPNRLLLYLRCLEPSAIELPEIPLDRAVNWIAYQAEISTKFPQLQTGNLPWWQIFTWEQAEVLLTQPNAIDSLVQLQSGQLSLMTLGDRLAEIGQRLVLPAIDTARWLCDELDRWAQEIGLMLLPTLAPATSALRSTTEELDTILVQLERIGMSIAPQARGVYQNLRLADISMRLYVVTWEILTNLESPEWSLLLILNGQPETKLPTGTTLRVCDETGILVKRTLADNSEDSTLYIRVVGTWKETFSVTVSLPDGAILSLPPFGFQPDR